MDRKISRESILAVMAAGGEWGFGEVGVGVGGGAAAPCFAV